jgi:hypothetical protein
MPSCQEKPLNENNCRPYRKPTQVDEYSKARGRTLVKELCKLAPYLRYKVCPKYVKELASGAELGRSKVSLPTVYQKHSTLLTRKRMYRV